jgi:hypothetical protein
MLHDVEKPREICARSLWNDPPVAIHMRESTADNAPKTQQLPHVP